MTTDFSVASNSAMSVHETTEISVVYNAETHANAMALESTLPEWVRVRTCEVNYYFYWILHNI